MNNVSLIGRLTTDPKVGYSGETCVARYTLAVDRMKEGTDFINCVSFGKGGEFADKYFKKGMKVAVTGRIQTGNYVNKDGQKVYTTDVVAERQEFCERKEDNSAMAAIEQSGVFMEIHDGIEEQLPFN